MSGAGCVRWAPDISFPGAHPQFGATAAAHKFSKTLFPSRKPENQHHPNMHSAHGVLGKLSMYRKQKLLFRM